MTAAAGGRQPCSLGVRRRRRAGPHSLARLVYSASAERARSLQWNQCADVSSTAARSRLRDAAAPLRLRHNREQDCTDLPAAGPQRVARYLITINRCASPVVARAVTDRSEADPTIPQRARLAPRRFRMSSGDLQPSPNAKLHAAAPGLASGSRPPHRNSLFSG